MELFNDVAIVFEGGGMRSTYSGAMASVMLEHGVKFPLVAGVSAGTTIAVNFLLRNTERMHRSFVGLAADPKTMGVEQFLRGNGYFNSHYLYEEAFFDSDLEEGTWEKFVSSDIDIAIGAFNQSLGEVRYWHKKDITSYNDLCRVCRASSSLPMMMPPTFIDGVGYVDGGVRECFALRPALEAGYKRLVIMPTHLRGYRREPSKVVGLSKILCHDAPLVTEALRTRSDNYNKQMELIEAMEASGQALVIYPDEMPLTRTTSDPEALEAGWQKGLAQGHAQIEGWLEWLRQG